MPGRPPLCTVGHLRSNCSGHHYAQSFHKMKVSFAEAAKEEADRLREEGVEKLREEMVDEKRRKEDEEVTPREK